MSGYMYSSNATTVGADGSFNLKVNRQSRLIQPTVPDTATVALKFYETPTPVPASVPFATRFIRMNFAPLGEPVDPTIAQLVLAKPPD
jgi:hypothetical protein